MNRRTHKKLEHSEYVLGQMKLCLRDREEQTSTIEKTLFSTNAEKSAALQSLGCG